MSKKDIHNVAIVGAGTMGHALAMVHAIGGLQVSLQDVDQERLHAAPGLIVSALDTLIAAGSLAGGDKQLILDRISLASSLGQAVDGADLIVEAVVEEPEVKRVVFEQIDSLASVDAILASNTSYLDVFPLIPARRQARSLVAHWYTPPYVVDLVDIAPGPETEASLVQQVASLYRDFWQEPRGIRQTNPRLHC